MPNPNYKSSYYKYHPIVMQRPDFVKEHQHLVKLLRTGTRPQLVKEANSQIKEVAKYGIKIV